MGPRQRWGTVVSASAAVLLCVLRAAASAEEGTHVERVSELCRRYWEGFGSESTDLVYHHRLNGPKGIAALSSPAEIARGEVAGKPVPFGYGSGIQDVALEGGHFLYALCEAHEATHDPLFAEMARRLFRGMKRIGTVSHEPGFVPRGPHPDGRSYYRNSSRDQHCAFVEALWRFGRSPLAAEADRAYIADALDKVAARMERHHWQIRVEDGSDMAHVGWTWLQPTSIGAITLLSVVGEAADAGGSPHWREAYDRFSNENGGARWRRWLYPDAVAEWQPLTLYANQFAVGLHALAQTERDEERRRQIRRFLARLAERALRSNVFDTRLWRRLDWAGSWSEEETEAALAPFGLSLRRDATVADLYRAFDVKHWASGSARTRSVNGKLCFGIPTVAFHIALLSEDPRLVAEVAPHVRDMARQMLAHGDLYTGGEDFNRAVVLGLHLAALGR